MCTLEREDKVLSQILYVKNNSFWMITGQRKYSFHDLTSMLTSFQVCADAHHPHNMMVSLSCFLLLPDVLRAMCSERVPTQGMFCIKAKLFNFGLNWWMYLLARVYYVSTMLVTNCKREYLWLSFEKIILLETLL